MLAACLWRILLQSVRELVLYGFFLLTALEVSGNISFVFGLQTTDGCTPLYAACDNGHVDIVTALLAASANVDAAEVYPELWTCSVYNCTTCVCICCDR